MNPLRHGLTTVVAAHAAWFATAILFPGSASAADCYPPPANLVGWWAGESNAFDTLGADNGTVLPGISYQPGIVGLAFHFDGSTGAIIIPPATNLAVQSFTFEAWINPTDTSIPRPILEYGDPGQYTYASFWYGVNPGGAGVPGALYGIVRDANPNNYVDLGSAGGLIKPNRWTHVAFTFDPVGLMAKLYINGTNVASASFPSPLHPVTTAAVNIGLRPESSADLWGGSRHIGGMDEVSIYSRALSAAEISNIYAAGAAGKCTTPVAPTVYMQPTNQDVFVNQQASFLVAAWGTLPLTYQWLFEGNPISGATNSLLMLDHVQINQAGAYSVQISNVVGSVTSSNALLTVNPPPPCASPPSGLVAWWTAESNENDVAGNNNGLGIPAVNYADGVVSNAFSFFGGNFVQVPNSPSLSLTSALSLELWYKDTGCPVGNFYYGLIGKRTTSTSPSSANYGVRLFLGNPASLQVYLQDTNQSSAQVSSASLPTSGVFHHVVATYEQATSQQIDVRTYVDGQLVNIAALTGNLGATTNSAPLTIGSSDPNEEYFNGLVDEPTIYRRALSASEVQALYNAGISGKCPTVFPVSILLQPNDEQVTAGEVASFAVGAVGSPPLSYQWNFLGTPVQGATNSSLMLSRVQADQAGAYSVTVSNQAGSLTSSNASLTVDPAPPCAPPAPGLISWWPAETNAEDFFGGNNGTILPGITFTPGIAGEAFNFDGTTGAVIIPASPNLEVQSFTIEAWIKPSDVSIPRPILEYGDPGQYTYVSFWYGINPGIAGVPGALYGIVRDAGLATYMDLGSAANLVTPNVWSHVAFTFDPIAHLANLYINGTNVATNAFSANVFPNTKAAVNIGLRPEGSADLWGGRRHMGGMDEVSIYGRALTSAEIQAIYNAGSQGKCMTSVAPVFYLQPPDQTVTVGQSATFSSHVSGTQPVLYQWAYNGSPIAGATTPSLLLTNVQRSQAGLYSVQASNSVGTATSSNAVLLVNFPPASLRIGTAIAESDGTLALPILLNANGNENALGFSLSFSPNLLSYSGTTLESAATNSMFVINTNLASIGKVGFALSLAANATFPAGTQELMRVSFLPAPLKSPIATQVGFGDEPTTRELSDPEARPLAADYVGNSVQIPAADFEGDVSPRPNGDKGVTITDWVQEGRYAARLDYPTNAAEYQRADCAPRSSLGDGAITVADWVQAGRYTASLDPATRAGGPTNDLAPSPGVLSGGKVNHSGLGPNPKGLNPRQVKVSQAYLAPGQSGIVPIVLQAQGDENALGFSLNFDPSAFTYSGTAPGASASKATIQVNDSQTSLGRIAVVLALPIGATFQPGPNEVLKVILTPVSSAFGTFNLALTDQPVTRQVVDALAQPLASDYVDGSAFVNPLPTLTIAPAFTNVTLSWPLWATNYSLQEVDSLALPSLDWTNVQVGFVITNNEAAVNLPLSATTKFYRLKK